MKSIHHNSKPTSHWFSIIFVVMFISMASDVFDSTLDTVTNFANFGQTNLAAMERQIDDDVPQADSQPNVAEPQQHTESAERFTRVYREDASLMEKASYMAEFAYFHVVRVKRKLFQYLTRTIQHIRASIDGTPILSH